MELLVRIGVSACLLGEQVRYDGTHKHDFNITGTLGKYFSFVPVCPEVGCGLPVPREAMQLEGDPLAPRLMTIHSRVDKTELMRSFCSVKVKEIEEMHLSGFIFKERSPSCGLLSVPLHGGNVSGRVVAGIFADALVNRFTFMPMEEAERLANPLVQENFVERVLQYCRKKNALCE